MCYLFLLHWNIHMVAIVAGGEDDSSAAIGVQPQNTVLYDQDLWDNRPRSVNIPYMLGHSSGPEIFHVLSNPRQRQRLSPLCTLRERRRMEYLS